jgi:hypothetical protein
MLMLRSLCIVSFFGLLAACNAVEPEVGPRVQDAGASCGKGAVATTDPYSGATTTSGGDAGACVKLDPRCVADAGYEKDECDHCADTSCCNVRFDCYDNPGCFEADQTLDECVDGPDAGGCWSDFESATPLAKIVANCLRASCASQCDVP